MKITPTEIISDGPGVDLSNLPDGISVKMSDPVEDPAYARNAVTLVYDLTDCEHVGLAFAAKEFGEEPHGPPPSPFGDDAAFDGVAVSVDGTAWYEVKALRDLRSDRFLNFDIDLDAEIAQLGLSYNSQFRIRFCQYDNNPAPMDGIFLHGIELMAELSPPVFHLPMDDNAADAIVRDASAGGLDQVFIDPTGDPSTAAHSVPGPNGQTALAFDGVDDLIAFGQTLLGEFFAAGCDFSLAFWYKSADPGSTNKYFFRRADDPSKPLTRVSAANDRFYWRVPLLLARRLGRWFRRPSLGHRRARRSVATRRMPASRRHARPVGRRHCPRHQNQPGLRQKSLRQLMGPTGHRPDVRQRNVRLAVPDGRPASLRPGAQRRGNRSNEPNRITATAHAHREHRATKI